jgi:hypothetical protein
MDSIRLRCTGTELSNTVSLTCVNVIHNCSARNKKSGASDDMLVQQGQVVRCDEQVLVSNEHEPVDHAMSASLLFSH